MTRTRLVVCVCVRVCVCVCVCVCIVYKVARDKDMVGCLAGVRIPVALIGLITT